MRRATDGLAEKTKKAPIKIRIKTKVSVTLSTVHHQLAIRPLLILENANTLFPPS